MEIILSALCIAISGVIIGWIFGYNQGSEDIGNIYKDVYDIKEL